MTYSAIYNVTPTGAERMLGRPVGPNHLGELFVAVDYDAFSQPGDPKCRIFFEPLLGEAKELISEEYRNDFVKVADKTVRDFPKMIPEWHSSVWRIKTGLTLRMMSRAGMF